MSAIDEKGSETDATTSVTKPSPMASKKMKIKFVSETTIHNLKREEIYKYIVQLHKRIQRLVKKCRSYKKRVRRLKSKPRQQSLKEDATENGEDKSPDVAEKDEAAATNFIADIKNAAQEAQNNTGFIYEPTSGLYYDSRTGYYYNAEHGLYYDGNRGCYYSYNQEEQKFEFHSQVYADGTNETNETVTKEEKKKKKKQNDEYDDTERSSKKKKKRRRRSTSSSSSNSESSIERRQRRRRRSKEMVTKRRKDDEAREDGELSDDDDCSDDEPLIKEKQKTNRQPMGKDRLGKNETIEIIDSSHSSTDSEFGFSNGQMQDVAKKYPPSIRIVVQETKVKKLKIGELFLITYKGGSLGREGTHDVIIPDINCSKYHLRFTFDEKLAEYTCTDLGSRNGTLMNGKRMSNAKQESDAMPLKHGTVLQIGLTKLLCHIHDGHSTCGHCEPGLIQGPTTYDVSNTNAEVADTAKLNAVDEHKRQLKNLKKRYGLEDEQYVESRASTVKNDRAAQRRQKVGSSCDFEKTKTASLDTSIPSENKGFKMLAKLGWNEGQSLGKNKDGLLEPIGLHSNQGTMGLGCEGGSSAILPKSFENPKSKAKTSIWKKTQDRYKASEVKVNMFGGESDDSG